MIDCEQLAELTDTEQLKLIHRLAIHLGASDSRIFRRGAMHISDVARVTQEKSMNPAQHAAYEHGLRELFAQIQIGEDSRLVETSRDSAGLRRAYT